MRKDGMQPIGGKHIVAWGQATFRRGGNVTPSPSRQIGAMGRHATRNQVYNPSGRETPLKEERQHRRG